MVTALTFLLAIGSSRQQTTFGAKLLAKVKAHIITLDDLYRIEQFLKTGSMTYGSYLKPEWRNKTLAERAVDKGPFEHMVCPVSDERAAWLKKIAHSFKVVEIPEVFSNTVNFKKGDCLLSYIRSQKNPDFCLLTASFDPSRGAASAMILSIPDFRIQNIDQFTGIPEEPEDPGLNPGPRNLPVLRPINGDFLASLTVPFKLANETSAPEGLAKDWMSPHAGYQVSLSTNPPRVTMQTTETVIHQSSAITISEDGTMQYPNQDPTKISWTSEADMKDCIRIGEPFEFMPGTWRVALDFYQGTAKQRRNGPTSPAEIGPDTIYLMFGSKAMAQQAFDYLKHEVRP